MAVKGGDLASRAGYDARVAKDQDSNRRMMSVTSCLSDYWGPQKIEHSAGAVKIESPRDCCELCKETSGCQFCDTILKRRESVSRVN